MTTGMEELDDILDPPIDIPEEFEPSLVDMLPRGYLSISQVTTYLKCAHSWQLRYVEGKVPSTSARMFQGIQVHKAVEQMLEAKLRDGVLPPLEYATEVFANAFEEQKPLIQDWEGVEPGSVKDTGVLCTKTYHQEAAPVATPVYIEKSFHKTIKSKDGKLHLPMFGRIDSIQVQALNEQDYQTMRADVMVDRDKQKAAGVKTFEMPQVKKPLRIHDLKVVTDKWSENDLPNDIQFALYAGIEGIPDVQVDQVVKGRAKTPRPRYEVLSGVITDKQVQHTLNVVEGVAKGIVTGNFPMTDPGNWWCSEQWCSVWKHCRGK